MASPPSRVLSLFSGYGGLDIGLTLATGCRSVCYVEREAFAASVLVARMEEKALDSAPVWDDVATFDGKPWRGVVDCVAGGSPCQDLSVAGKQAGLAGERSGLFFQFVRVVREAGPAWVWWENVGGAIKHALDVATEEFEGLGYRVAACTVRASDVGAPHERLRLFVLAHSHSHRREGKQGSGLLDRLGPTLGDDTDGCDSEVGHPAGLGRETGASRPIAWLQRQESGSRRVGVAADWPPGPDDCEGWRRWAGPQPAVCRDVDGASGGLDFRNDRLRLLGNGVVPQQAAAAFLVCYGRLLR